MIPHKYSFLDVVTTILGNKYYTISGYIIRSGCSHPLYECLDDVGARYIFFEYEIERLCTLAEWPEKKESFLALRKDA